MTFIWKTYPFWEKNCDYLFSGCIDGICVKPNQCTCRDGWVIDNTGTRCDAKCERPCFNGNWFKWSIYDFMCHFMSNLFNSMTQRQRMKKKIKKIKKHFQQVGVNNRMFVSVIQDTHLIPPTHLGKLFCTADKLLMPYILMQSINKSFFRLFFLQMQPPLSWAMRKRNM